jgi:type VI secretion system secreted protein VgrG
MSTSPFPLLSSAVADFPTDTRLYQLDSPLGPDALLVESWVGREALSELSELHIDCLGTDTHIPLQSLLGQQLVLRTRLADGQWHARSGYAAEVAQLGTDGGLARYRVSLVPWLAFAQYQQRSRVWQEQPVLAIIEDVLAAYAPRNNWRITADADAFLAQVRPRSYCCQYRETDYAFLTRLLAEEGIGFHFDETDAADDTAVARQQLVLFADTTVFAEDAGAARDGGIRFHRAAGIEQGDSIQALGSERRLQPAITTVSSWDYKASRVIAATAETAHRYGGPHAPRIEANDWAGVYAFATQQDAEHYARILRDATDARFKDWFGNGNVRSFRTGTAFRLLASPLDGIGQFRAPAGAASSHTGQASQTDADVRRRFCLLGVLHAGVNNLPVSLHDDSQARLGAAPPFTARTLSGDAAFENTDRAGDSLLTSWERNGRDWFRRVQAEQEAHCPNLVKAWFPELYPDDDDSSHIDPAAWQPLLARAKDTGYANRFTAIRADIVWRPALFDDTGLRLNPRPTVPGSQTAIVVGPDGSTANAGTVHTDHLGRIRIRYHWQTGDASTCWVRVAQLFAGPGYGAQFIPRIGQEVLVSFFDNDIDRPLVTGVLYNGRGQDDPDALAAAADHAPAGQDNLTGGASPAWHGAAGSHRQAGFLSGFKSVALGADGYTRQANQLVFDDSTGRLRTQLATDTAATQLNLGHLLHQADNYRGSFRGTGWEVRTDAYGAIRAGRGVLMSTYYGKAPGGGPEPAGDNAPGIALLKQAQGFADTFNRAAATHQTVQFILVKGGALNGDTSQSVIDDKQAPIAAMLAKISGLVAASDGSIDGNGQPIPQMHAPLVVVTAQAGIGVAASDGLHVAAGEVAHLASGRDMHVAVGDALSIHSGQAIGLLAGAVGAGENDADIQLYAGQGDVQLQAQSDAMTLAAHDLVRLISANSHVDFAAAKSITLCTEGGASLTIEGGNITFACPGTISIKAASKSFAGPAGMGYALPVMPRSEREDKPTKLKLSLQDMPGKTGQGWQGKSWKIVEARDSAIEGGLTQASAHLLNPAHWEKVLYEGKAGADGDLGLTAMQQQELHGELQARRGKIWLIHGLQVTPLQPGLWSTDEQGLPNPHKIMAALNYGVDHQAFDPDATQLLTEWGKQDQTATGMGTLKKKIDL